MSDGYLFYRKLYGTWSGSLPVTTLTGATTLVMVGFKGQNRIYVQRIHVNIVTAGAVTWTIEDSAGVDVVVFSAAVVGPPNTGFDFDFGPIGFALTPGTNLVFTPSAPGAAGSLSWDAYQRQRSDVPVLP